MSIIADQTSSVKHDPDLCGLFPPSPQNPCPACRQPRPLDQADIDDQLTVEWSLRRRPRPLGRRHQARVLGLLLDIERTCRHDADFADALRTLCRLLLQTDNEEKETNDEP
jgi:hypothetical protein